MTEQRTLPCLQPAETVAYKAAEARSAVRGVDCGPDTTVVLLDTIRRLAHVVTYVEELAQRAQHAGGGVDPDDLYRAVGSGAGPLEVDAAPPEWEWGVRYAASAGGPSFTSAGFTEAGARRTASLVTGRDWSGTPVQVVRRPITDWQLAPEQV